jgi:hypothetical protein
MSHRLSPRLVRRLDTSTAEVGPPVLTPTPCTHAHPTPRPPDTSLEPSPSMIRGGSPEDAWDKGGESTRGMCMGHVGQRWVSPQGRVHGARGQGG